MTMNERNFLRGLLMFVVLLGVIILAFTCTGPAGSAPGQPALTMTPTPTLMSTPVLNLFDYLPLMSNAPTPTPTMRPTAAPPTSTPTPTPTPTLRPTLEVDNAH